MQFGTADRRKADVAEGVAIAVSHVATRRGNRLGSRRSATLRRGRSAKAGTLRCSASFGLARLGGRWNAARRRRRRLHRTAARAATLGSHRGERLRRPLDWRRPLLELAGRHDVVASRSGPARTGASECGRALARRPGDRRQLRADTGNERLRPVCRGGRCGARRGGPCACIRRSAPGGADDRGRLAPSVRGLSASRPTPVSFESPRR